MLYKIGTWSELALLEKRLPEPVYADLAAAVSILDAEYGAGRNYMESGGYAVVLEVKEDLQEFRQIVNFDRHPCEWADKAAGRYLSALYLMNDDYGVVVFMPIDIAPEAIIAELED